MIDAAMKRWGQIDCLFNNASGNSAAGPIDGLSYTDFLAAMDFRGSVFPGDEVCHPSYEEAAQRLIGAHKDHGMTDEEAERALGRIAAFFEEDYPLKSAGKPEDIVYAAVYLASDESESPCPHTTRENLVVDSGITLGRSAKLQAERGASMQKAISGA